MAEVLLLPRLGETMDSGRVVSWQKKPGEGFRRGETIVEVESDKTVVELPALVGGILVEILAAEGDDIPVGAPLCRYERADAREPGPSNAAAPPRVERERGPARRATPAARSLARKHGIELDSVVGTGRHARVGKADILALVRSPRGGSPVASESPAASDAGLRFVDVPSGRLAYRSWPPEATAQPSIVLLHGFAGSSQAWSQLATLIARAGVTVVAPDLPGHGETQLPATSLAEIVEPIVAFVRGLDGAIELVGHSLGGAVAVTVALLVPERIGRLTLVAPAGLGSEIDADFVAGMAAVRSAGALAHLLRRIAVRPAPLSRAQLEQMALAPGAGTRLAQVASIVVDGPRQQLDIIADLDRLPVPARVIWGLDDRIIPWTHVTALPAHVPVHLVSGAGHMPHWDQPAKVAALFARPNA